MITIPEGAGAFAAYRFDMNGDLVELPDHSGADMLAGRVAVLDLGAGTGDTYQIFDGNLNPDAIAHATDDKAGVINNLLKPILTEVLQAVPQAKHLTTAHIDSYLRQYVVKASPEAATIRVSGKTINIEKAILANCERYAEWVAANKLDPLWGSGMDAIVEAGGGWLYIESLDQAMVSRPAAADACDVPAHQRDRIVRPEWGRAARVRGSRHEDAAAL